MGSDRISDAMLDAMLAGTDAATVFHSGELLSELRQRLAERILDAEVHLDQEVESERGNTRNGHHRKTVLTDDGSIPLAVPRGRVVYKFVCKNEKGTIATDALLESVVLSGMCGCLDAQGRPSVNHSLHNFLTESKK